MEPEQITIEDRVYIERVRSFFGSAVGNVGSAIIGSFLIALVLKSAHVMLRDIIIWMSFIIFFSIVTIYIEKLMDKEVLSLENASKWLYIRILPSSMIALMYGITPFLFADYLSTQEEMFIFIILSAMISVAIVVYTTMPYYYLLLNALTMMPLSIYFLSYSDFIHYILAATSIIWQYLVISKGWKVSKLAIESISLNEQLQDETKQHEITNTMLVQKKNELETIINTVPARIFWKDKDGLYLGANKLFLEDAQLKSSDEIIGKSDFEMPWGKTEAQKYRDDDLFVMNSGESKINFEESQTDDEANTITLLTSKVPLIDNNATVGILATYVDISQQRNTENELKKQKDILYYQAHHDSLTGLPNRILFNDRLEQAIQSAKRHKTNIALLFIDLDHFKEINDSLGHNFGDEILKTVSKRLNNVIRNEDTIARLGGDEFILLLEDLKQPQDVSLIANKILGSLSKSIIIDDNTLYVSCSIGISIYPDDGVSSINLLKYADSAMYKAKEEGRNNFQYYNSTMTELAFERVLMETSLRAGLEDEEFVVYYQPQMDGVTNQLIGMEALVRWQHPTMGLVSPDKFIPLAEATGLIVELDRLVMKIAMTQFIQWHKDGLNPGKLAMNLAIKQLKQEDCLLTLQNLMKETGCKAELLELEVTEGQIMTNPEEAIKTLQKISDIGIELAVDDFGTGYSSLAYLKRLPINKLKIDQAFIYGIPEDEEDAGITKAIIALAHSLNLKVIAEGVETKEQKDFLVENGCKHIQGHFYSKAVPADKIEVLLKKGV